MLRVTRMQLAIVRIGQLARRAVELDFAQCDDSLLLRRSGHLLRCKRRTERCEHDTRKKWIQHKRERADGEDRSNHEREH